MFGPMWNNFGGFRRGFDPRFGRPQFWMQDPWIWRRRQFWGPGPGFNRWRRWW